MPSLVPNLVNSGVKSQTQAKWVKKPRVTFWAQSKDVYETHFCYCHILAQFYVPGLVFPLFQQLLPTS